jgi:tetratricopeptide (TPR) repeat protein
MSLLLEALKKAEKAKEEAQRRAKGGDASEPAGAGPDPDATVAAEPRHVMTKDELPDISAPLEILTDDLQPPPAPKAPLQLSMTDEPPATQQPAEPRHAPRREPPRAAAADNAGADRAAAQKVFEAKFREPNPRLPFFITMGVLGVAAVGIVIYFYIQLRPPPPLVNTKPQRPSDEKVVEVAAAKPAADKPAAAATPTAIPGLPDAPGAASAAPAASAPGAAAGGAPAAATAAGAPAAAPAAAAPATAAPATPVPAPAAAAPAKSAPQVQAPAAIVKPAAAPRATAPAASAARAEGLNVTRGTPQIHPQVAAGYAAYQSGDLNRARTEYQQVLREEPSNRDALLGLAATEMRAQRYDAADGHYQRLLQMDPRDPHAQAGMLALRNQQIDPVVAESRVKSMLAADREATVLYFTLGNQYAQQGRWAEAQQAYFKAFAADPDNPDFAFNLAVSLDQLRQPRLALDYYRKALALAEKRSAAFALDAARGRIQQLSR